MGDQYKNIKNSKIINRSSIKIERGDKVHQPKNTKAEFSFKKQLKDLIANDKTEKCLGLMSDYFKRRNNIESHNKVIMISSRLKRLSNQLIHQVISHEQALTDRNKINNCVLEVIDEELS